MGEIELVLFMEEIKALDEMIVLKVLGYERDILEIFLIESYSLKNINNKISRLTIISNQKEEFIFNIIVGGIIVEEDSDIFIIPIHSENTCLQIEKF